jgi:ubiquinone/menaquinone biosynthesis C-methylase UbiE
MTAEDLRKTVREGYGRIAREKSSCCAPTSRCCGGDYPETTGKGLGYSDDQLASIPQDANLGLGCGSPVNRMELKPGEMVLDLGSGGGMDCFLAAREVGSAGRVIGVDMTPDMIDLARRNAVRGGFTNVEFRLGEIEHLPAADASVDAMLSNCVINLSPDKEAVFREMHRVLKSGGRFVVSDIVLTKPLPDFIRSSAAAYNGCIAGALLKDRYLELIQKAGFRNVQVLESKIFPVDYLANDPSVQKLIHEAGIPADQVKAVMGTVESITVKGWKP